MTFTKIWQKYVCLLFKSGDVIQQLRHVTRRCSIRLQLHHILVHCIIKATREAEQNCSLKCEFKLVFSGLPVDAVLALQVRHACGGIDREANKLLRL